MDLVVSINENKLKLSVNTKDGFKALTGDLPPEAVDDSSIKDTNTVAQELSRLIAQLPNINKKQLQAVFLVEPRESLLLFVTIGKTDDANSDEHVIAEIRSKLENVKLEDLYFSYQKIAPFVYQFVCVRKEILDSYLQIATTAEVSLKAVVPWVLLLPKFLESNDPAIFIIRTKDRQSVALAELNGIYYCEDFELNRNPKEILGLIQKLSVYKRAEPIHKVFTVIDNDLQMGDGFDVSPLIELSDDFKQAAGYEVHLLTDDVLANYPDYLLTQVNLLNLLPVPVVQKSAKPMVYAGVAAGLLLLALAGFAAFSYYSGQGSTEGELALEGESSPTVLSENETAESTETEGTQEEESDENNPELDKTELVIRIENGAGIPGIAGEAQTFLEEKGYTILDVGNADEQDRQDTMLKFKDTKLGYKDLLVKDMEESYELVVEQGLGEELEYDVLIVIGAN